jgi:hypothetical protein
VPPRSVGRLSVTWTVVVLTCGIAAVRASTASVEGATRRLSLDERRAVGRAAAAAEPAQRKDTWHRFPGACWAEDDDFHATEWSWVRGEASRRGVPVIDVLLAIDEDLRAYPVEPPRKSNECPSKPLPYYD